MTIQTETLLKKQLESWDLARDNFSALNKVQIRKIEFPFHSVIVQHNPHRIISSSAKTDPVSINNRPCFLCSHNRPALQMSIEFEKDYQILVNPYPIFPKHLTIPSVAHIPQRILPHMHVMFKLCRSLPDYTLIYNGPHSGASAPDHFHFQAVQHETLPVEKDFLSGRFTVHAGISHDTDLYKWHSYSRNLLTCRGNDPDKMQVLFTRFYRIFESLIKPCEEPMMNMLMQFDQSHWIMHIFPRKLHRPSQYFEEGNKQLMISPASIDMGGIMVVPRQVDYERLQKTDVESIYRQVCTDESFIQQLIEQLLHG